MRQADLAAYYSRLVETYGGDHPMSGHWRDEQEATEQYRIWREVVIGRRMGEEQDLTVLDFGCGTGVGGEGLLFGWKSSTNKDPVIRRTGTWFDPVGCDICREALRYTPYPAFLGDHTALRPASVDWVLAMGCFNIGYKDFFSIRQILDSLWDVCRTGLAVSFSRSNFGDKDITAHPLHKWLRLAERLTRKSRRYVLRADWSLYSSLLILWKERQ